MTVGLRLVPPNERGQRRASRIARQTRSGVAGIAMSSTPSGRSASTIALMTVGVAADGAELADALGAERVDLAGRAISSVCVAKLGRSSARGMP